VRQGCSGSVQSRGPFQSGLSLLLLSVEIMTPKVPRLRNWPFHKASWPSIFAVQPQKNVQSSLLARKRLTMSTSIVACDANVSANLVQHMTLSAHSCRSVSRAAICLYSLRQPRTQSFESLISSEYMYIRLQHITVIREDPGVVAGRQALHSFCCILQLPDGFITNIWTLLKLPSCRYEARGLLNYLLSLTVVLDSSPN